MNTDTQVVKVYVSVFGDERGKDVAIAGLKSKAKYVRSVLGRRMKLRLTPEIRFIEDESFERGSRVNKIFMFLLLVQLLFLWLEARSITYNLKFYVYLILKISFHKMFFVSFSSFFSIAHVSNFLVQGCCDNKWVFCLTNFWFIVHFLLKYLLEVLEMS